jgi:SAM-dependent methyltransferase
MKNYVTLECLICGDANVGDVSGFGAFGRVTSDCRPWPPGGRLGCCASCGAIQKPTINQAALGGEQVIFDSNGAAKPRSQLLLQWLVRRLELPRSGRLLDVGCGNGAALRSCAVLLPEWKLFGSEVDDFPAHRRAQLPPIDGLYTGALSGIAQRFDLVLSIHSLEHMFDPVETLRTMGTLLAPGGSMLVQVPNVTEAPFDIVIADHVCHFREENLALAMQRAGLASIYVGNGPIRKELTAICRREADTGECATPSSVTADSQILVSTQLRWMQALLQQAGALASAAQNKVGIFGTANAAAWLAGNLADKVGFFVDEDPGRIGHTFLGLPIVAPSKVPGDAKILMPFAREVAEKIRTRHPALSDFFTLPPV